MHVTLGTLMLPKIIKTRLSAAQNKCNRLWLKLGDRTSITINEFENVNWAPINDRVDQCTLCSIYKFYSDNAPGYMKEMFSNAECNWIPIIMVLLSKIKTASW